MHRVTLALIVAAAAAACNPQTVVDPAATTTGGQGGSGTGGGGTGGANTTTTTTTSTTTSTTTTTVPEACAVASPDPAPYAVTFRVTNPSGVPAFVRQECHVRFDVMACADGYSAPLGLYGDCTLDCNQPGPGCIACGACMMEGRAVTPDQPVDASWSGQSYTFGMTPDGCQCSTAHPMPAAKYRVRLPVYASKQDAEADQLGWEVSVDFQLPAPGGIVEIPIFAMGK